MEELKACPFCGGKTVLSHTNHRSLTDREHMFKCLKCGALIFLRGGPCVSGTVEETEAEATELFNRRPAPENKPLTHCRDCTNYRPYGDSGRGKCLYYDYRFDVGDNHFCGYAVPNVARKPEQEATP